MGWQDLLSENEKRVLPWLGERRLAYKDQIWRIAGRLPEEFGWYTFEISGGRTARLIKAADPDFEFEQGHKVIRGYLAGERLIPDGVRVDPDPDKMIDQTISVLLVEQGLDRFARAVVIPLSTETGNAHVYIRQEFPVGPEMEVEVAYQDRLDSVAHVAGVTPALDLAFRWHSFQRVEAERREAEAAARRAEEEKKTIAEEKLRQAMKDASTGAGRRALAAVDFSAACRAALGVSGATLLDARPHNNGAWMVVQYRYLHRRLECVVEKRTLRIVDSGVCLNDHHGEKGDNYFTLESLPAIINDAMLQGRLVVYRHAPGDVNNQRGAIPQAHLPGGQDPDRYDDEDDDW